MLVSTNSFLNSIKANDKGADAATLKDAPKANIKSAQSGTILNTASTITAKTQIQDIFQQLAAKGTSKETILATLKNSALLNNLGSVSSDLKSLLNMIKGDPKLAKFEAVITKFLMGMEKLDANSLQKQISQSGVFLESKLAAQTKTTNIAQPLKAIIQNIQTELAKIDSPIAKQTAQLLDEVINNPKLTKANIVQSLQEAVKQLKTIISNTTQSNLPTNTQLQNSMTQLQNLTIGLNKVLTDILPQQLKPQQSSAATQAVQQLALQSIEQQQVKTVLTQIQQTIAQNPIPNGVEVKQVLNKLLTALPVLNEAKLPQFTNDVKTLVNMLSNSSESIKSQIDIKSPNLPQLMQLAQKLETLVQPNSINQLLQQNEPVNIKQLLSNDMKAVLLQLKEEVVHIDTANAKEVVKHSDKMLGQIEYFQALSYASMTQTTFLPFVWDMMEEGELSFKKLKDERFFVQINLKLKEFGKIDLMVILHDENQLDISIFAQKKIFKNLVQVTLPKLKKAINQSGLIPANIRLLDMKEDENIKQETNAFVDQEQIGSGISIRV